MKSRTIRARAMSELLQDAATFDSPWGAKPGPQRPMPKYGGSPERAMAQRLAWRRNMLGWQESVEDDGMAAAGRPLPERRPTFVDAKGAPRRFGSVEPVNDSFARSQAKQACDEFVPAGLGQTLSPPPAGCGKPPCEAGLVPRVNGFNSFACCKPGFASAGCACSNTEWPDPDFAGPQTEEEFNNWDQTVPCKPVPSWAFKCMFCGEGKSCGLKCSDWSKQKKQGVWQQAFETFHWNQDKGFAPIPTEHACDPKVIWDSWALLNANSKKKQVFLKAMPLAPGEPEPTWKSK